MTIMDQHRSSEPYPTGMTRQERFSRFGQAWRLIPDLVKRAILYAAEQPQGEPLPLHEFLDFLDVSEYLLRAEMACERSITLAFNLRGRDCIWWTHSWNKEGPRLHPDFWLWLVMERWKGAL